MVGKIIGALTKLTTNLIKLGYINEADEITELLNELLEEKDTKVPVNVVGLRGDVKPEEMNEGMSIEPFFSDPGTLT